MPSPTLETDTLASIELGATALTLVYSDRSLPRQLAYSGDPVLAIAALSKESGETPGVVVHGQDTVDPFGLSAHFDLDANAIGAVVISDAKSGLIRLHTAPVGRSLDC